MRINTRLKKLEETVSQKKMVNNNDDLDERELWLIKHCPETKECIRELFRLQCEVGISVDCIDDWNEPTKSKAIILMGDFGGYIQ